MNFDPRKAMLSVYNVFFPAKEHAEISVSLFLELL